MGRVYFYSATFLARKTKSVFRFSLSRIISKITTNPSPCTKTFLLKVKIVLNNFSHDFPILKSENFAFSLTLLGLVKSLQLANFNNFNFPI